MRGMAGLGTDGPQIVGGMERYFKQSIRCLRRKPLAPTLNDPISTATGSTEGGYFDRCRSSIGLRIYFAAARAAARAAGRACSRRSATFMGDLSARPCPASLRMTSAKSTGAGAGLADLGFTDTVGRLASAFAGFGMA